MKTILEKFVLGFLNNKPIAWLCFVAVVCSGVFGFFALPQQYNPEVTLPSFQITTQYPGATAEEVKRFVTERIEEKVEEIPGVDAVSSYSFDGGTSLVNVSFTVQEDLEEAKVKLFSKIQENKDLSPDKNISDPLIKTLTPDDTAVVVWMLTSKEISQNALREKALSLASDLRGADGVSNVLVTGGTPRALQVLIDPEKLKEQRVTLPQVVEVLRLNNGRAWIGDMELDTGSLHQFVIDTRVHDVSMASKIVVSEGVTLGDIAELKDGYAEERSMVMGSHYQYLHTEKAVFVSIAKRKGENTNTVVQAGERIVMEKMESPDFQNISFQEIRNQSKTASKEIFGLGTNLLQSLGIVSLVLLIFLGARPAFLVALAIPLSLLFVFFAGHIFDQTINRITLFALILSLGLMVDAATVVVENIYRHLNASNSSGNQGKIESIVTAVQEVGMGLFLSTLTSVLVFLPLTQINGMMGPYMGPLAFFVPAALLASLIVAYFFTPFFASLFLSVKKSITTEEEVSLSIGTIPAAQVKPKLTFFSWLAKKYSTVLQSILDSPRRQNILLFSAFSLLFLSFLLIPFQGVQFQMLPKADNDTLWVTIDLQEGSGYKQTQELALQSLEKIRDVAEVESIMLFTAQSPLLDFNGLFRGFSSRTQPHQASLLVSLKEDRKKNSETLASDIRALLHDISLSENAMVRVVEDPPGPPVSSTLVVKIFSDNEEATQNVSQFLHRKMYETEGVVDIDSSVPHLYPSSVWMIDFAKAKQYGISAYQVYETLQFALLPHEVSSYFIENAEEKAIVEVQLLPKKRDEQNDLEKIMMMSPSGEQIPLSALVKISSELTSPMLWRDDHRNGVYINAEMEGRSVVYATIDLGFELFQEYKIVQFSLYRMVIEEKETGKLVTVEWGGEAEMTLDNFRDLLLAMAIAFALVYAVLVAQFRSFIVPLLIMATIPLSLLGILPGFALLDIFAGIPLTATALIGFIALLGIVINNAIIYLEYLQVLKNAGMDLKEALIEAGKTRLRPILLTSLTTVLGSLTIAFDPVWSGLAWSIVFGLSFSAILTLIIFPVLYWRSANNGR